MREQAETSSFAGHRTCPRQELELLHRQQDALLAGLAEQREIHDQAEAEMDRLVREARRLATTWDRIGDAVGMARQNAWRRWR